MKHSKEALEDLCRKYESSWVTNVVRGIGFGSMGLIGGGLVGIAGSFGIHELLYEYHENVFNGSYKFADGFLSWLVNPDSRGWDTVGAIKYSPHIGATLGVIGGGIEGIQKLIRKHITKPKNTPIFYGLDYEGDYNFSKTMGDKVHPVESVSEIENSPKDDYILANGIMVKNTELTNLSSGMVTLTKRPILSIITPNKPMYSVDIDAEFRGKELHLFTTTHDAKFANKLKQTKGRMLYVLGKPQGRKVDIQMYGTAA